MLSENVWINQHPISRIVGWARKAFLSSNTLFIPSCNRYIGDCEEDRGVEGKEEWHTL